MRKLSKGAVSSGAHAKVVLLTLSCFKEFEFGNGDGTMEIAKTSSVSPATL
jgi:hypothetical protein